MKKAILTAVLVMMVMALLPSSALAGGGEDLFKAKCVMCHGADGSGNTAMGKKFNIRDLRSADVQKQTDAQLETIITKGKDKMPSYEGKLTKEQIQELVQYVRGLGKK